MNTSKTCIIDEAGKFWLEPGLRLSDQAGDALLARHVAANKQDPVLSKLGRQLRQGGRPQNFIFVRETNFGT